MKRNVQTKRFMADDKDGALSQASGMKVFCDNPDCKEQAYDLDIYALEVLASTDAEIASIPIEPPSGAA